MLVAAAAVISGESHLRVSHLSKQRSPKLSTQRYIHGRIIQLVEREIGNSGVGSKSLRSVRNQLHQSARGRARPCIRVIPAFLPDDRMEPQRINFIRACRLTNDLPEEIGRAS